MTGALSFQKAVFSIIKYDNGIHIRTPIPYESDPSKGWKQIQLPEQSCFNNI